MKNDPNLASYLHPKYEDSLSMLTFLYDMWSGKGNWHRPNDNNEIYDIDKAGSMLPEEHEEPTDAYINRLIRSRFERRFRNAIEKDLSGLLSRFAVINAPRGLLQYQSDVDLRGTSLRLFLREADRLALRDKYCFVLVEYPPADPNIESEADRLQSGRRPYLVLLPRASVINWKFEYINGQEILTLLVFKKLEYRNDGEFGVKELELYYVLKPGSYIAYELIEENGKTIQKVATDENGNELAGETTLDYIPVEVYSLTDVNTLDSDLSFPLQDLAEMNLELYQLESDKREILHKSNLPTLVVDRRNREGFLTKEQQNQKKATVIGPNSVNYDCTMTWVEPTGRAIAATMEDINNLNLRMDTFTLAFLSGTNVTKTATEAEINSSQTRSNFANMALAKESNFNNIAWLWGLYEGEEDEWAIEMDRDLFKSPLDLTVPEVQDLLLTGTISRRLALTILKAKKVFGENFTEADLEQELATNNIVDLGVEEETVIV